MLFCDLQLLKPLLQPRTEHRYPLLTQNMSGEARGSYLWYDKQVTGVGEVQRRDSRGRKGGKPHAKYAQQRVMPLSKHHPMDRTCGGTLEGARQPRTVAYVEV